MIEIKLTQDQVTWIDDIDSDLANLKWYAHWSKHTHSFYSRSNNRVLFKYHTEKMHRVILSRMLGRKLSRSEQVDHINHNTLDNRRENLRLATNSQNKMNGNKRRDNTSGYKGVSRNKNNKKYRAQIKINQKKIHLGYFDDPIDAALAYDNKAKKLFGEYANLNFKD